MSALLNDYLQRMASRRLDARRRLYAELAERWGPSRVVRHASLLVRVLDRAEAHQMRELGSNR